jgi:hypothetical protein
MEEILTGWKLKYYSASTLLYEELIVYYPRFDNYNRF